MRKGTNPAKNIDNKVKTDDFHQVIVPVYLPNLEGYYKEGLDILKLCLESIAITTHNKTFISVVNNGSCSEVRHYLNDLLKSGKIQEVIHTTAIGKINAIAKGLAGHDFDLVTITDADVLFINGWQKAVYDIYETFPKAGMVCTTPQSKRYRKGTEIIFWDNIFRGSDLKFRETESPKDMREFMISIGTPDRLSDLNLNYALSLKKNESKACLGAGHFCSTYRASIFQKLKANTVSEKISPSSDRKYIDQPVIENGYWRLSTYSNYTYHMGNHLENWMSEIVDNIIKNESNLNKPPITKFKRNRIFIKFKRYIIRKLLFNIYVWPFVLRNFGLTKEQSRNY